MPPTPPTGGSGSAGSGAGSAGSGASGTGGGNSGGAGAVEDFSCVHTSILTSGDTCVCTPCTTPDCGQGTCAGFSDCCGVSALGTCQCADPTALGLSCVEIGNLLTMLGTPLTQVDACP